MENLGYPRQRIYQTLSSLLSLRGFFLPVVYHVMLLGIPFGNSETSTQLATQLDEKLMSRLRLWKGRARTLMGWRLIVQSVILSLLWYFTTTVNIPARFITRWQSAVTRFILYNRVGTGPAGINVVPKGLATQQREDDGISVPIIALSTRRQRFTLLQQLVQVIKNHRADSEEVWYRPIAELLRHRYGTFSRRWTGDFLLQNPPKPLGWRQAMLPLWWRKLHIDWKRVKWPDRNSLELTRAKVIQRALYCPIWWNTSPDFQVGHSHGLPPTPLGEGTIKFKHLCQNVSAMQKLCLADFFTDSSRWLTAFEFFCDIHDGTQPLLGSRVLASDIFALYHQLTQIFDRFLPHPLVGKVRSSVRGVFPPVFGVQSGKGTNYFPNLKLNDWIHVLYSVTPAISHPMKELGCPQTFIHETLSEYIGLRRCLLPVVHDVILRMFFGDLIVGSRLYFLKALNPTVQQCVRESCTAIETVKHCFFSCPALGNMWQTLWAPWSEVFLTELEWRLLLFPKPIDINVAWRQKQKILLMLWRVHTAIAFHATWRLRNDIHFRETQAESLSTQAVVGSFCRHCQFIYSHSGEIGIDGASVVEILRQLGFDTPTAQTLPRPERPIWIPRTW